MNKPNAGLEFALLKQEDIQEIMELETKISSRDGGNTILLAYKK